MAREFGIIGYPLKHSFSPSYFNNKFEKQGIDAIFSAFEIENILQFKKLLQQQPNLCGLSVTIPYKKAIIPFLDALDDAAIAIGAVNCIAIKNGQLKGINTDVVGFEKSLQPLLQPHHNCALILGSGGSSLAVKYVFQQLNIPFQIVSRKKENGDLLYETLTPEIIQSHLLIINTTPLGMYPKTDACVPIPYGYLTPEHLLFDLVYNPNETLFLQKGSAHGATIKNGLEMLHLQAERSWEIWNES
jgi:shikimate dehydrogenase